MKELICIKCPKGCHLHVDDENGYAVFQNFCKRVLLELRFVYHDLKMFERRAVVERKKRHGLAVARRAHPTCHAQRFADILFALRKDLRNVCVLHS